jgi:hypothetical protein
MKKEGEEEKKMFIRIKYLLQDTMTIIANSRRNTRPFPLIYSRNGKQSHTNGAWHELLLQ